MNKLKVVKRDGREVYDAGYLRWNSETGPSVGPFGQKNSSQENTR